MQMNKVVKDLLSEYGEFAPPVLLYSIVIPLTLKFDIVYILLQQMMLRDLLCYKWSCKKGPKPAMVNEEKKKSGGHTDSMKSDVFCFFAGRFVSPPPVWLMGKLMAAPRSIQTQVVFFFQITLSSNADNTHVSTGFYCGCKRASS